MHYSDKAGMVSRGRVARRHARAALAHCVVEVLEQRQLLAAPIIEQIYYKNTADWTDTTALTIPAKKSLIIPVQGADEDAGDVLTYTATSSNRKIKVRVHSQQNTYLKLSVTTTASGTTGATFTGDLVFQLFDDITPQTVERITNLVTAEFYSNLTFHRIANLNTADPSNPSYIVQGGNGTVSFTFEDEFNFESLFTGKGQLAMAKPSTDDSNSCQFFITQGPVRHLDLNHTIFGQMVRGWDVLDKMIFQVPRDVGSETPKQTITISKAEIVENTTDAVMTIVSKGKARGFVTIKATDQDGETTEKTVLVDSRAKDTTNQQPIMQAMPDMVVKAPRNPIKPIKIKLPYLDMERDRVQFGASFQDGTRHAEAQIRGRYLYLWPYRGYTGPISMKVWVQQFGGSSTAVDEEYFVISVNGQPIEGEQSSLPIALTGTAGVALADDPEAETAEKTVAFFFDTAEPAAEASTFLASIDWGDGKVSNGTISKVEGTTNKFVVKGTNTYKSEGTYRIRVNIASAQGVQLKLYGQVTVADGALTATPVEITNYPGNSMNNITVATFTDADPNGAATDFAATIDWGDNTGAQTGAVTKSGTTFSVAGTHLYHNPGTYDVLVTITDKGGSSVTTTSKIFIGRSSLTVNMGGASATINEGSSYTLQGSFTDSAPPGGDYTAKVDWGDGDGFVDLPLDQINKTFTASHQYKNSSTYKIRVIVTDSTGASGNGALTMSVTNVAPSVDIDETKSDDFGVRGQPRKIEFAADDVSEGDRDAGFTYQVEWGDNVDSSGNPTTSWTSLGKGLTNATHTYKKAGTYTVKLKAIDQDGGTSSEVSFQITIADVDVQSSVIQEGLTDLVIGGTFDDPNTGTTSSPIIEGHDTIEVVPSADGSKIMVKIGGQFVKQTINGEQVDGEWDPTGYVIIYGGDGNDVIRIDAGVPKNVFAFGDAGNDTIAGGIHDDVLVGGGGDDSIVGNGGRDLIIGSSGMDYMHGDNVAASLLGAAGDDILVAGTTRYDSNITGLVAYIKEWTRTDGAEATYANRIKHLAGDPAGLNTADYLLKKETITNDYSIDTLLGGGGEDLFFASPNHFYSFAKDAPLSDKLSGETLVELT